MNHRVIDNYLANEDLLPIKDLLFSNTFPWFYTDGISSASDQSDCYFVHTFYRDCLVTSSFSSILKPILEKINPKALVRCRALLYIGRNELIEHGRHVDFDFSHKTNIIYLNTNNGFTRLNDGYCVNSVENRALFFDGSLEHNSTNCTDQRARVLITTSYF